MSKEKGQQLMEDDSFPLEFELPDGKDALQSLPNFNSISFEMDELLGGGGGGG